MRQKPSPRAVRGPQKRAIPKAVRVSPARSVTAASSGGLLLDQTNAAFLRGPVAMNVASCDAKRMPSVVRGYGCRISSDRRRVTVFLSVPQAEPLLRDLRAGHPVAVVFTRPKTHETLQLKGADAAIASLGRGDRDVMTAYAGAFAAEIAALGYTERFSRALVSGASDEAVGVTFSPTAAFVQTPGPTAGQRLEPKA